MYGRERRHAGGPAAAALRVGLNEAQLKTLNTMEQFRWTLRFVRRPLFQDPQPVLFNRDGSSFVVLERDGRINETPDFKIRG
jgi:hypothetical protein